jgi:hypothetical protein
LLFGTLLVFYVLVPIVHEVRDRLHPRLPLLLEGGLFFAIIIGAVVTAGKGAARTAIALLLGLTPVLLWIVRLFVDSDSLEIARDLLGAVFFTYAIWAILIFTLASRRVTINTVCASLCIYLLLGLVWALAYSVVDMVIPGAFTWTLAGRSPSPRMRVGKGDTAVLYFSFSTLTTLGYGDIVPTSPISRMLATVEAIAGQLYLAVLVARLVGLHIAESIDQRTASGPEERLNSS